MKFEGSIISKIDQSIREGDHAIANRELSKLLLVKIPRESIYEVAALSRRLSRSEIGVSLLNPIVRAPIKKIISSTEFERAEYAACLIRLGIIKEAHLILDSVSPLTHPRSLLFRSFAHIAHWDFEKSGICLESFIGKPQMDPYEILIAKVNLAVGYVFLEKLDKAIALLHDLCEVTRKTNNLLLYSNSLELLAQASILNGAFNKASSFLSDAEKVLTSSDTIDSFFIKKDRVILDLFKSKRSSRNIQNIKVLKQEAQNRRYWEQHRDCDYYLALATHDKRIINHLYFGTPYEAYQNKLLSKFKMDKHDLPASLNWHLGQGKKVFEIDIATGRNTKSDFYLNDGQVPQRILNSLSSDFYRPKRLMEIFVDVFPDEYFSPQYSTDKMHQGLRRLRSFFRQAKLPLFIGEERGFYRLLVINASTVNVICRKERKYSLERKYLTFKQDSKVKDYISRSYKKLGLKPFKVLGFAKLCNLSERSALRYLTHGINKGWIKKSGSARFTRYRFL